MLNFAALMIYFKAIALFCGLGFIWFLITANWSAREMADLKEHKNHSIDSQARVIASKNRTIDTLIYRIEKYQLKHDE